MPSPSLKHDCPYCGAENQGFEFRNGYTHPTRNLMRKIGDRGFKFAHVDFLTFSCGRCLAPVVVEIGRDVSDHSSGVALPLCVGFSGDHWHVISINPSKQKFDTAPEHTPTHVAGSFEQGCRSLSRGDWDLAGMGFRKSLDVGTRQLIRDIGPPALEGVLAKSLKARIDWLYDQQRLTSDLRDWAHIIREDGNDAAHDEHPYLEADARELHDFSKVFLMYVFTIPALIKDRRGQAAEGA